MIDNNNLDNDTYNLFDGGDFVFTTNKDGEYIGGGYKINSIFLNNNTSPIITINTNTNEYTGGKVSSPFENLAVPAGLFYVNMHVPKKNEKEQHYKNHDIISDDIMDKLYSLVEFDKKRKRKTRKSNVTTKLTKNNTRKLK
jgi:hypothetical protein